MSAMALFSADCSFAESFRPPRRALASSSLAAVSEDLIWSKTCSEAVKAVSADSWEDGCIQISVTITNTKKKQKTATPFHIMRLYRRWKACGRRRSRSRWGNGLLTGDVALNSLRGHAEPDCIVRRVNEVQPRAQVSFGRLNGSMP